MGEEGGGLLLWREGDGVDESAEFRGASMTLFLPSQTALPVGRERMRKKERERER